MTKTRNRAKQTTTLDERILRFVADLQQKARTLEPNTEEARLLHERISQGESALRLNQSLNGGK
jgi:hypothetical protein